MKLRPVTGEDARRPSRMIYVVGVEAGRSGLVVNTGIAILPAHNETTGLLLLLILEADIVFEKMEVVTNVFHSTSDYSTHSYRQKSC